MQLKRVVDPFGEVNVYPAGAGKSRVVATILMEPHKEGCQTGIALDGSGSMANLYGSSSAGGGMISNLFGRKRSTENQITPVAQKVCAYLARKLDADGGTTCIYWAVGPGGGQVQEIADFTASQAEKHIFEAPNNFGTGTRLLPAMKFFVDKFSSAPFGFYAFITDGQLHDLDEVKAYTKQLAQQISSRKRFPLKCILIGIGADVDERQMEELDDLETGTDIDIWDHKLAAELRQLEQIFAEVVDNNARIAPTGKVVDASGRTVKDYSDVGVPAKLEFEIDSSSAYFTLKWNDGEVSQPLRDDAQVPAGTSKVAAFQESKPAEVIDPDMALNDIDSRGTSIDTAPPVPEKSNDPELNFDLQFDTNKGGGFDLESDKK
jgi:hypothetical protein